MNKKTISSVLAACMCATTFAGMGITASAEDTAVTTKTLLNEDFDGDSYKGAGNASGTFAFSESYNYYANESSPGEKLKGDITSYYYAYNNQQPGDMSSYYDNLPNMRYVGSWNNQGLTRGIVMFTDKTKEAWYAEVKLAKCDASYEEMAVGALAEKALDVSVLIAYKNGVKKGTAADPIKTQLVFTVNGEEKIYDLGEKVTNTSDNRTFNNAIHVRNTLSGILNMADAWDTATDIKVRIGGKMEENLKEVGFDNFLIKEVNPKEVFSEDFDERAWFGYVRSTDFLTKVYAVDTIYGIDMTGRGKVLKLEGQRDLPYNHTMEFPIANADSTKCYKVALDVYYPTTNANTTKAEVWVKDNASSAFETLIKVDKNSGFEHFEGIFDFSNTPEAISDPKNLRLMIKYGDGVNAVGDSLYVDNITVTEVPFEDISANQGSNWFTDKNTLANGDLNVSFRNTEKECVGIVAEYKADGTLSGLSFTNVGTTENAKKTVTVTDDVKKVSAFMWNMDNVTSIIPAVTLTKPE